MCCLGQENSRYKLWLFPSIASRWLTKALLLATSFIRRRSGKLVINIFWHCMGADIQDYYRSSYIYQHKSRKGRVKHVSLEPLPVITKPSCRMDCRHSPPSLPSADGHKHFHKLINFATGFQEAIPLKDMDSVSVAEVLFSIFSRVEISREILSDRGTPFT